MRRQYLPWVISVIGIIGTVYGAYLLIYHFNHGNGLNVLALVLLILGILSLGFSFAYYLSFYFHQKKTKSEKNATEIKNIDEEKEAVSAVKIEKKTTIKEERPQEKRIDNNEYNPRVKMEYRSSSSSYNESTIYVKQVGYGPLLRINGSRIVDIRTNTYYRIEGNMVIQEGYGPLFEIRGNQIKDAFGGYLYEYSGNNINKVFGGFYASISGNYITLYDLSIKYEMTDSLSNKQMLAIAVLLFGKY